MRAKLLTALLLCCTLISCEKDENEDAKVAYLTKWLGTYEGSTWQRVQLHGNPNSDLQFEDLKIIVSEGKYPKTIDMPVTSDDEDPYWIRNVSLDSNGTADFHRNKPKDDSQLESFDLNFLGSQVEFYNKLFNLNGTLVWGTALCIKRVNSQLHNA